MSVIEELLRDEPGFEAARALVKRKAGKLNPKWWAWCWRSRSALATHKKHYEK